MIKSFLSFNELLNNDQIGFIGLKNNKTLHNYSFLHIMEEFRLDNDQIFSNFMESPIIIVNQYIEDNSYPIQDLR